MTDQPLSRRLARRSIKAAGRWFTARRRRAAGPLLSVVVPVYNSGPRLRRCLESLAAQSLDRIEVVLVDDGSTDGSLEVARDFADRHDGFRLVTQAHRGVGPARDEGVRAASGEFLAFCDSDDDVPPGAYERLVGALQESGSDLAIGSVMLQSKGVYRQPEWARRSNPDRRLGVTLDEAPEVVANLLPGTRAFRRSFWDRQGLSFGEDDHRDVLTMVQAVLAADRIDVLAGVTYRWGWREDGTSLLQRDLRDGDRVRCKLTRILEAGDLVQAEASPQVQRQFFADVLQTVTPDLVRAAVCRDDGYWASLQTQMQRLMQRIPDEDLGTVAVEDRVVAWLCARAERQAAEDFLEYSFDNQDGYPYREVDGQPHIALPFVDAVSSADSAMTRVAPVDMRYRTRLNAMRWVGPGVLRLDGAAFVDYVDDTEPGRVTVVLRERSSGAEQTFPASPVKDPTVNRWSARAQEDHSNAAFECDVEVASLPRADGTPEVYDVRVRLEVGGHRREAAFQNRRTTGSPGLLESSVVEGTRATPVWNAVRGLSLRVRVAEEDVVADGETPAPSPVTVTDIAADTDAVALRFSADEAFEIALAGPRTRTTWTPSSAAGVGFEALVSLLLDEWGAGERSLPTDDYTVLARRPKTSAEVPVGVDVGLWRELPLLVESPTHVIQPKVLDGGRLVLRVAPVESRDTVGSFVKRRLRDEFYPAARERPLLDAVLFETFAGRAAGDNPGPLCEELARRETGLDLVFSVVDRSVPVPDGARSVIRWSSEWFELVARARCFVTNAPLPPFFRKRPGQLFLHTWHGTPLKRIAHDRVHLDFPNWHHRRQLLASRDTWDWLVSQSKFCTESLRSAFRYDGEVLELGYPRNDLLCSAKAEETRRRTREQLGIPPEARVVLYAPTWRDNYRSGRVFDKIVFLDTAEVVRQLPGTVVLLRGHYNSMEDADVRSGDRHILDVTRYPDIADLYLAADALVTDYSSVFFDFALTDKPMYFLAPDLQEYRDENRGFYLDYHDTVPGPVAVTTEEVIEALRGPDEYADARERFRTEYTPWDDGHASERLIDVLLGRLA